jgi:phosphoenolpyruvate synthase/pyruvate phosphate dikinase
LLNSALGDSLPPIHPFREPAVPSGQRNVIEWLGEAASGDDALGGKGASLDRLIRLGYRVPPGFCVTTAAFRAVSDGIDPLDPELVTALHAALGRLEATVAAMTGGPTRLAVRSSAIGEDGTAASFAGLHETELDVAPSDVPGAVRRCWASLASAPAVAYRTRRGLSNDDAAMAVVVQALVPADAAAVVFTRHPVTGRDDQLVITAARGLGDAMVAGTVTPDTIVVDRATGAVLELTPGEGSGEPVLGAAALSRLVELSLAVERDFGRAVDIEAAIAGQDWYLLQARPITTAGPAGVQA